jgi:zinc protease
MALRGLVTTARTASLFALLGLGCTGERVLPASPASATVTPPAKPRPATLAVTPDAPFRHQRPAPLAATAYVPPVPSEQRLPNGLRVLVIERHDLPVVYAALVVQGGAVVTPHREAAAAAIALLDRGAGPRSAADLANAFDSVGARHEAVLGEDVAYASVEVPSAHLPEALALLTDEIVEPTYGEDELALYRTGETARTEQALGDPEKVLRNLVHPATYPPGHPYALGPLAHLPALAALRRVDVVRARARLLDRGPAALILVGDVSPRELSAALARLGRWKRDDRPRPPAPPVPPLTKREVWLVDRPGTLQSLAWCTGPGVSWTTPDRQALLGGNEVLGGFWMSRLNGELREKRGISYWVSSHAVSRRAAGILRFGGSFQREHTGEAVSAMLQIASTLVKTGLDAEEIQGTKTYLLDQLTSQYETDEQVGLDFVRIISANLDLGSDRRAQTEIAALTGEDIARALRAHIHPETMRIVVVGDRASVEPQLREAGLGDVSIRDAYGDAVR